MTDKNKTRNDQKAAATPRRYDEAYKQEAVRLWQSSGQSAEHTARELGISVFNLYEWRKRADRLARAAGAAGLPGSAEALQAEVQRLRTELTRMTEQRDILKKAAGILSEPSPSGMPGSKR
jgi:transposase